MLESRRMILVIQDLFAFFTSFIYIYMSTRSIRFFSSFLLSFSFLLSTCCRDPPCETSVSWLRLARSRLGQKLLIRIETGFFRLKYAWTLKWVSAFTHSVAGGGLKILRSLTASSNVGPKV